MEVLVRCLTWWKVIVTVPLSEQVGRPDLEPVPAAALTPDSTVPEAVLVPAEVLAPLVFPIYKFQSANKTILWERKDVLYLLPGDRQAALSWLSSCSRN